MLTDSNIVGSTTATTRYKTFQIRNGCICCTTHARRRCKYLSISSTFALFASLFSLLPCPISISISIARLTRRVLYRRRACVLPGCPRSTPAPPVGLALQALHASSSSLGPFRCQSSNERLVAAEHTPASTSLRSFRLPRVVHTSVLRCVGSCPYPHRLRYARLHQLTAIVLLSGRIDHVSMASMRSLDAADPSSLTDARGRRLGVQSKGSASRCKASRSCTLGVSGSSTALAARTQSTQPTQLHHHHHPCTPSRLALDTQSRTWHCRAQQFSR